MFFRRVDFDDFFILMFRKMDMLDIVFFNGGMWFLIEYLLNVG